MAIELFGEIQYAPAVDCLAAEAMELRIGTLPPGHAAPSFSDRRPASPLPSFEEMNPDLVALIRIGPPAAAPLVDRYVASWKIPDEVERDARLKGFLFALGHDSLLGAALIHIQKRLTTINLAGEFIPSDRDERDALHRLKRELLKGID